MRGQSVYQRWSGILGQATDRDFERRALPFLRLFWPSLVQTAARRTWDAKGIDLLVWTDHGPFPCVVQCKGFQVQELGNDQIRQVENSIEAFHNSDASCDVFLVVHNRDGRNPQFNRRIKEKLKQLVSSGKVGEADLWDRQALLDKVFGRTKEIVEAALCEHSATLLNHYQSLFRFGHAYISAVPVIEEKLIFKRGEPCSIEPIVPISSRRIGEILLEPSLARWTLLTGKFGAGKTTAVLHVAASRERIVILVPCANLPSHALQTSTNELLEQAVRSLNIFGEFEAQDQEVLNETAGPVIAYLLRRSDTTYALILDGLDENRAYSNYEGLQQLNNQLADLTCPVVLTTREEHLNAMFGNFSSAFSEFSTKKAPGRPARLLKLAQWGKDQVHQFITQVLRETKGQQRQHLSEFSKLLKNGEYLPVYGELPFNPLFLQFILEDVIEHGVRTANRCLLLRSWIEQKIRRDWRVPRVKLDDSLDVEDCVARMLRLMEDVANMMTSRIGDTHQLAEYIPSDRVREVAEGLFKASSDILLAVLLNSVLIPQSLRRGSNLNITFAFRVFHEYCLASYLVRENLADHGYPDAVRSFCSEIRSCSLDI